MRRKNMQNVVRSGWQRGRVAAGFTLIELIVVIVILGIAAAIVVPMASSASGMQLRAAANMVAADLEYAKSLAIGTGQNHSWECVDSRSYKIVDGSGATVVHPVKKSSYVVNFSDDGRLDQVSITSANFDGGSVVHFTYLGEPLNSGNTALSSEGVITLTAGGLSKTVRVEPVTGFVTISD